jgi:N-acetylmuramoyl-L-alanine amidase
MRRKKMIINVHAGHNPDGKIACGAVGLIQESTEARKVKDEVISQLRQLGHTVYDTTVDNGTSQSDVLVKIVKKCNEHTADLDISIHFNSGAKDTSGNGKTTGTEVYVYSTSSKAKDYAEGVADAISKIGYKNRGVKYSQSLYVLRKTKAPAMLIECCFVDDADDVELYNARIMASNIVFGITGEVVEDKADTTVDAEAADQSAETATGDNASIYRVQVGAYCQKANADAMAAKVKAAGFDALVVRA